MFTRERHRRGVVYFGPYANAKKVRETLDVLNRVFRFRPCEGPKPGRHSGSRASTSTSTCFAPCVDYISKEDYGKVIDGVIEFLSGETRPIIRELERRMAEAAADERFEEAARFRNRLFPSGISRNGRRPTSGQWAPWTSSGSRSKGERRGAGLPAPRREDGRPLRVPPRERRGAGRSGAAGGVRARVLRFGAVDPAADHRAARGGRHVRAGRVPLRTSWLACGGSRRRAGREAPAAGAREPERGACARGRHREGGAVEAAPGRGAGGAPGGAEPREPSAPDRVLRRLEHPGGVACRVDGGLPGRDAEGALPSSASAGWRQDDYAALAEAVSRRFARVGTATQEEYDEASRGAEPRRDRRWEGSAVGGDPGDAGVRPAAGRGRCRSAPSAWRRCSCRTDPGRSGSSSIHPVCSCSSVFGTRPIASRSTSTVSAAMRRRGSRSSTRFRASARRVGRRCSSTPSARRSSSWPRRRRSSRASRASRREPRAGLCPAAQSRPGLGGGGGPPQ